MPDLDVMVMTAAGRQVSPCRTVAVTIESATPDSAGGGFG